MLWIAVGMDLTGVMAPGECAGEGAVAVWKVVMIRRSLDSTAEEDPIHHRRLGRWGRYRS